MKWWESYNHEIISGWCGLTWGNELMDQHLVTIIEDVQWMWDTWWISLDYKLIHSLEQTSVDGAMVVYESLFFYEPCC